MVRSAMRPLSVAPGPSVGDAMREVRDRFAAEQVAEPQADAVRLVEAILGCAAGQWPVYADRMLSDPQRQRLDQWTVLRLAGVPVGRIIGRRSFYGLEFALSPGCLEPRPDTETLVDVVLEQMGRLGRKDAALQIADLGAGSGCVGLALLHHLPKANCLAIDCASDAVETAKRNAQRLGLADRFACRCGDWLRGLSQRFDVIVSNPPYIAQDEYERLDKLVRDNDPELALNGGVDGLAAYRALIPQAAQALAPRGLLAVETGRTQGVHVRSLLAKSGLNDLEIVPDLSGADRVVFGWADGEHTD